ncbi:MAG: hypothetical protein EOP47_14525 [Sphingobacteriaceae bacterium]|nr:MAG: hypothetical protein EOP47_14525 [Sphingobacteriaceae bacterium]
MQYLTTQQAETLLSLGKSIEQWLSSEKKDDYIILKWLRIDKEKDSTYSVSYIECFDDGDNSFTDIYEFSPLDPDEEYVIKIFGSAQEALEYAIISYSASIDKFVSAGMIQEEYKDYLRVRTPPAPGSL